MAQEGEVGAPRFDEGGELASFATLLIRSCQKVGLPVTTSVAIDIVHACSALRQVGPKELYWCSQALCVHRPEEFARFDQAFSLALNRPHRTPEGELERPDERTESERSRVDEFGAATPEQSGDEHTLSASRIEVLQDRDLATLSDPERDEIVALVAKLASSPAKRVRRRMQQSAQREQMIDLRRTVALARAHDGEIIKLVHRRRKVDLRRVVFLIDISGSMGPYIPAYLRLVAGVAGAGIPIEAFSLGTRLTRLTRVFSTHDTDAALSDAHEMAVDWLGGTRLGEALESFNQLYGIRGIARSATVVILSDGLDRGDPELLGSQVDRIHRVAHQVIWVNPLKGLAEYAPLARGMAAALPSIDRFVAGHSLGALGELARLLSEPHRSASDRSVDLAVSL